MLDFILGIALAAMLVRGWARGLVREALDLVGLVMGVWIAFRLSTPFGDFLTDSFGVSPEFGRIGGGIILFVLVGVVLSIAARYLSKLMNLPGLSMVNRVGGAAVAIGWGIVIVLILLGVGSVLPVPAGWHEEIDRSRVAQAIVGEDAVPRRLFETVAGDNVMTAIGSIRELFGSSRAVPEGGEALAIPAAELSELRQMREEALRVVEMVNEERVGRGLGALQPIDVMIGLAEDHAIEQYVQGSLRRLQDCRANLSLRDYELLGCDNGVALAGTATAGYQGILESESGAAMILRADFDRIGVAVVAGPTGRLVVMILGG